jgi:hypothetical protein
MVGHSGERLGITTVEGRESCFSRHGKTSFLMVRENWTQKNPHNGGRYICKNWLFTG